VFSDVTRCAADLAALDAVINSLQEAIAKASSVDTAQIEKPKDVSTKENASAAKAEAKPIISEIAQRRQGKGLVMGLVARVTDLLQLNIADVHIRLECNFMDAAGRHVRPPFSVGVVLGSVGVSSTNVHGDATGSRGVNPMSFIRKRGHITDLGIYVDHNDAFRVSLRKGVISTEMKSLVGLSARASGMRGSGIPNLHPSMMVSSWTPSVQSSLAGRRFLLKPVRMEMHVIINDSGYPPKTELVRLLRYAMLALDAVAIKCS
jgi:hypothetical protein